MADLSDFASVFGATLQGASDVTSKTVQTEQKVQEGIDTAQQIGTGYAIGSLIFQAGAFFTLLWIAGRLAKQTSGAEAPFEEVEDTMEDAADEPVPIVESAVEAGGGI